MTPAIDRELLRLLPKAELHCHLDGSRATRDDARAGTRARQADARAPTRTSLREFMRVRRRASSRGLPRAVRHHALGHADRPTRSSASPTSWRRTPRPTGCATSRCGTRRCSTRAKASRSEQAVEAPLRGLARAERDHGVDRPSHRLRAPAHAAERLAGARGARGRVPAHGVVGFDLAGGEVGNPARFHAAAFEYARSHDLACTCHAGEGDDAVVGARGDPRVRRTSDRARDAPHRGHVAHRLLNDRRIALEICLTSNVQTRVVRVVRRRIRSANTSSAASTSCSTPTIGS